MTSENTKTASNISQYGIKKNLGSQINIFTKIINLLRCWLIFSVVAKFKVWIVNVFLANLD